MFTTINQVKELTGYDVTNELVFQAQAIIEIYTGRTEAGVNNAEDRELLSRATAYQAAYMFNNYSTVFEQVGLTGLAGTDGTMSFDITMGSPYIAPLAALALRGLSRRGNKSVKIGSMFGRYKKASWERD